MQESALNLLREPAQQAHELRPTLQGHGSYVFGVFLVAVAVRDENRVYYQEIDVVATSERLITRSKTSSRAQPRRISANASPPFGTTCCTSAERSRLPAMRSGA